jgi:hypothetical protein
MSYQAFNARGNSLPVEVSCEDDIEEDSSLVSVEAHHWSLDGEKPAERSRFSHMELVTKEASRTL